MLDQCGQLHALIQERRDDLPEAMVPLVCTVLAKLGLRLHVGAGPFDHGGLRALEVRVLDDEPAIGPDLRE